MNKKGTLFGGTLLIAGTCIGGGMLALPVLTCLGGFVPSLLIFFLCWLFMACTGLLFLELSLWTKKDANIITMAETTLGKPGKFLAWGLYLFLFYCLILAYLVGCGSLIVEALNNNVPDWVGPLIFVLIFAPIIYAGTWLVGKVNIYLMFLLALLYVSFIAFGLPYVDLNNFRHMDWGLSWLALPISFTAFAYQGTVPTLISYLDRDIKKIRLAIVIGSFIPLVAYIIWQTLIFGIIPVYGPGCLAEALEKGKNAVYPLKNFLNNPYIYLIGQCFAFIALLTSFFGVSLGLIDFLADGLHLKKDNKGKLIICSLIFIPTLILGITYPHSFLIALDFAGGFGCAMLLGLMPILMVWFGRYRLGFKSEFSLPGGKITLFILLAFVIFELGIEIYTKL